MKKLFLTVAEVAEKIGVTPAYVRELLNRSLVDNSIKLKGTKVGKEWRIHPESLNEYLGITSNAESEKEVYIKELESKLKLYEFKFKMFENLLNGLNQAIK